MNQESFQYKTVRSAWPLYLVCAVWLVGTFLLSAHGFGLVVTAVASVVAYLIGKAIFPTSKVRVERSVKLEPEPKDPEIAALKKERDASISQIRQLNDAIQDPDISRKIDHIEGTTRKIYNFIMEKPEKKNQIRRFFNYYLPTTIKLLSSYDKLTQVGVGGENIDAAKRKIENMLDTVVKAFDKQLDALYADDAMDISADVTVLNQMMQQEGLTDNGFGTQQTM